LNITSFYLSEILGRFLHESLSSDTTHIDTQSVPAVAMHSMMVGLRLDFFLSTPYVSSSLTIWMYFALELSSTSLLKRI